MSAIKWELVMVVAYGNSTYDMMCLGRTPQLYHKKVQIDTSTYQHINIPTDEKRASQTPTLRVAWCKCNKRWSVGYQNQKKWTCQTCLTHFGREEENWTFFGFQSRHVMTLLLPHHMINYFEYNHTHLLNSRPPTTSFLLVDLDRLRYKTRGGQ
jgi:hypothetical protein